MCSVLHSSLSFQYQSLSGTKYWTKETTNQPDPLQPPLLTSGFNLLYFPEGDPGNQVLEAA